MGTESAIDTLRQAIVDGDLLPNERLVEADLSRTYGFKRANIRTALALLEQEGLVAREPNRGARVRLIDTDEALEILDAREALEGMAARHAAANATAEDVENLRSVIAGMRALLDQGDLMGASDASGVLHGELLRIARHETVERLVSTLKSQTVRFQYRTILVPGRPEQAYEEHGAIVEGIAANDPDAAEKAMRVHLQRIKAALRRDRETRGRVA